MVSKTLTLKFKRTVNAPPAEVYYAFTRSTALRQWLCDAAQADARKGGRLYLRWNSGYFVVGEFTTLELGKKIAFTWRGQGEPDATRVQVSLTAKDGGALVTLTHAGLGSGKKWAGVIQEFEREWENVLENLQSVMETGQDLRYVRRPMMGINFGEFNAEIAARLGVPVVQGIRLGGVAEGMGAQTAGLQKDDVIVRLGGKKITSWTTLFTALQAHRAGDKVAVVLYRGAEKKTVTMKLSPRPLPEIPPTAEALAEAVRTMHAGLDGELGQCLAGVSEDEASHRSAPGEWNVKETVAHLVATEHEIHIWITDLINDDERWADRFENSTNVSARIGAIVAVSPTVSMLLEDLKRNHAETVAMLGLLPPEIAARKRSVWVLGRDLLQAPEHVHEHLAQIKAAVETARKP